MKNQKYKNLRLTKKSIKFKNKINQFYKIRKFNQKNRSNLYQSKELMLLSKFQFQERSTSFLRDLLHQLNKIKQKKLRFLIKEQYKGVKSRVTMLKPNLVNKNKYAAFVNLTLDTIINRNF